MEGIIVNQDIRQMALSDVLRNWHKEYDVNFAYDSDLLSKDTVDIHFVNEPMEDALKSLIGDFHLTFSVLRNTVLILPITAPDNEIPSSRMDFSWQGRVVDMDTGEALPFATLRVAGTIVGTTADENGRFVLDEIPSDTSTIITSYVGYNDQRLKLTPRMVDEMQTIELKIHRGLLPQAIIYGESVDLIKTEKVAGIQTISCRDLAMLGSPAEPDVLKTAQLLPGIDATGESANGLIIRGSDSDQTLVQMDGYTIYHLDHFFGIFSAFNPATIKSMRIHKGLQSATEGGRTGGRVELIARDGNSRKLSAQADAGLLTGSLLLEGPIGDKGATTFMVGLRRAYSDLYQGPVFRSLFNNLYNASVADASSGKIDAFTSGIDPTFSFFDFTAKLTIQPSPGDKIQLSFYNGRDNFGIEERDTTGQGRFYYRSNDQISWGNTGASVRWMTSGAGKFSWENTVGYSRYQSKSYAVDSLLDLFSTIDQAGSRFEDNLLKDFSVKSLLQCRWLKHTGRGGIAWSNLNVDHSKIYNQVGEITAESQLFNANIPAIFVQDTWRPNDQVEVEAGFRGVYYDALKKWYPEPRLSVVYAPTEYWSLKFAAGQASQFIHRVQVQNLFFSEADYWRLSDGISLPVIRSNQVSGGANVSQKGSSFDVELYKKWNTGTFENFAPYFSVSGGADSLLLYTGSGEAWGADVLIQKDFRRNHLWLGYGYQRTWNRFPELGDRKIPESFEQIHQLKVVYQLRFKHWDASAAFFYGSGKPFTPLLGTYPLELVNGTTVTMPVYAQFNSGRLPAYHRMDLSAAYLFDWGKTKVKIMLSAFNVYNHTNIRDVQYFAIPGPNGLADYSIGTNEARFLGFTPSLFISLKW